MPGSGTSTSSQQQNQIDNQRGLLVKLRRGRTWENGKQERGQKRERARYWAGLTSENVGHLAASS
jgi:hypothetical protein